MPSENGPLPDRFTSLAGSGRKVRLYSRIVSWMKVILPLSALAVISALYFAAQKSGDLSELFTPEELATLGAGLRLDNPRFAGVTDRGEPFAIRADWALPDSAMPSFIDLEKPEGEIELNDGRTVAVAARTGRMHREEKILVLQGDVVIDTSDGYHVETARLDFDLDTRSAHAPGPVTGVGPSGQIDAGSFRSVPKGPEAGGAGEFWFENRVRLVLSPPDAADAAAQAPASGAATAGTTE